MNVYVIPGAPIPLARPRFGKHVWDSQKLIKEEVGLWIITQRPKGYELLKNALELHITFYFKRSKHNKLPHHSIKPDLSNLIKFYEDVCTGILYDDDKQIIKIVAEKNYDDYPRTEFYLKEIE
ncbi:RusA family crossover junction endodeoxyribonuclease [Methylobacter sp.]|uniref:RusA family crossover junction endodeoxyribonuclease n=1 Tax=Methylobacter sp. TaxID=2051955 RepID=UPI003DA35D89